MTDEPTRKQRSPVPAPATSEMPTMEMPRPATIDVLRDAASFEAAPYTGETFAAGPPTKQERFEENTLPRPPQALDDGPTTVDSGSATRSVVQQVVKLLRDKDRLLALAATLERGGVPDADRFTAAKTLRDVVAAIDALAQAKDIG
jgi:hypothetical protein